MQISEITDSHVAHSSDSIEVVAFEVHSPHNILILAYKLGELVRSHGYSSLSEGHFWEAEGYLGFEISLSGWLHHESEILFIDDFVVSLEEQTHRVGALSAIGNDLGFIEGRELV